MSRCFCGQELADPKANICWPCYLRVCAPFRPLRSPPPDDGSFPLRAYDTEPDRTTDDFLATHPTHHSPERTTHMSKDTDGGEAQLRVRIPLGSPSQPTTEVGTSPDCTELRSVSTDGNRPDSAPLDALKDGDEIEVLWVPRPEETGLVTWVKVIFRGWVSDGLGARIEGRDPNGNTLLSVGRTAIRRTWAAVLDEETAPAVPALDTRSDLERLAAGPEAPAVPEPRRCTAPITDDGSDGAVVDQCGAILGRDLACELCEGQRCYQHCASIDHFPGVQERGYYDGEDKPVWKIRRIDDGRYRGQLLRFVDGKLQIVATVAGATGDDVQRDLEQRQRELSWAAPTDKGLAPAQPTAVPLPVLEFVEKVPRGLPLGRDKRAELVREVIEWLRDGELSWEQEIYVASWDTVDGLIESAKKWHDQRIAELFSRLAGAL